IRLEEDLRSRICRADGANHILGGAITYGDETEAGVDARHDVIIKRSCYEPDVHARDHERQGVDVHEYAPAVAFRVPCQAHNHTGATTRVVGQVLKPVV